MTNEEYHWLAAIFPWLLYSADLAIRIGFPIRIIMRRRSHGTTFAWLFIILLFPFLGALIYLLIGENRISEKRIVRVKASQTHYQHWLTSLKSRAPVGENHLSIRNLPLHQQAERLIGIPALGGNDLELIDNPNDILNRIITDINHARSTCHLQFYIWQEGGKVTEIEQALSDAARRGVTVRILLDSIGSRDFLNGNRIKDLIAAGIKIREALPAGIFKALFERIDIRNHRKMVIIDGEIAYTGSQNMVDPRFFKQDQGVGEWVDLMVRITGPVVESLAGTFISDWFIESNDSAVSSVHIKSDIEALRKRTDVHLLEATGSIPVQLVPSGPGLVPEAIHSLLLTTIYTAREELILTTPYFVPDNSLLTGLKSAAQRGVEVILILPEKNDSKLVAYASRAHYQDLAESGVKIMKFHRGLLHSKTITVDRHISLFGSVNLDMRSFWLNFEATLFIYDQSFTQKIRTIQQSYLEKSIPINQKKLAQRPLIRRFQENVALLIGPLL